VNSFGIDRHTLTSANALIPIAYYLYLNPKRYVLATDVHSEKDYSIIHRWLLCALVNSVFGGHADNLLRDIRAAIKKSGSKLFPVDQVNTAIAKAGKKIKFDKYTIANVLDLRYGKPSTFLALSLLYPDADWKAVRHDVDHIFASTLFETKNKAFKGLPDNKKREYLRNRDSIANLEILTDSENRSKSGTMPLRWLETRDKTFRKKHLLPVKDELLAWDKFNEFITHRRSAIEKRLAEVVGIDSDGVEEDL
jgi:hypothetical protein